MKDEHLLFRNNGLHGEKKIIQRKMANLTLYRQLNGRIISRWSQLICHVEVRHFVSSIVRKFQSCASTWKERQSAFRSDIELQKYTNLSVVCTAAPLSKVSPPAVSSISWVSTLTSSLSCHDSAYGPDKCSHNSGL